MSEVKFLVGAKYVDWKAVERAGLLSLLIGKPFAMAPEWVTDFGPGAINWEPK